MSRAEIRTFGCRLNAFESEVMRGHTGDLDNAIIFNSCAVTGEAVRQVRQAIRKARRERPDAKLIVTGCAAQIDPESFAAMPEVDQIVGNKEKLGSDIWQSVAAGRAPRIAVNDIMAVTEQAGHLIEGFSVNQADRARAFIEVQNGCDHRCTFCIIPYGRGNSRSVPAGAVIDQVKRIVDEGFKEVVLTGVDLTSYGPDLPGQQSLGTLVQQSLAHVPDLARLRISSIDSIEVDEPLMEAITSEARLMPHLHLSLQSGDNMILKRMKRRHLRDDAIRFCEEVRRLRPEMVLGADIIAGFPTETEAMFENSLKLVEECGLTFLHIFPYSPREGTPAAKMPQVDKAVTKGRAARLRALGERQEATLLDRLIGTPLNVLIEKAGSEFAVGHSEQFASVRVGETIAPGTLVRVSPTHVEGGLLHG